MKSYFVKKSGVSVVLSVCLLGGISDVVYGMKEEPSIVISKKFIDRSQEEINKVCAHIGKEFYETVNPNYRYTKESEPMYVESTAWKTILINQTFKGGEKKSGKMSTLQLKDTPKRLSIRRTLKDLWKKQGIIDCTIAQVGCQIDCLIAILGEKKFDEYAMNFYKALTMKELQKDSQWSTKDFFFELPRQFLATTQNPDIKPSQGHFTYITNISQYSRFKPKGNGRGYNALCVGEDQYMFFSQLFKEELRPRSLKETINQCFVGFCRKDNVEKEHENHTKLVKMFEETPSVYEAQREKNQKEVNCIQYFDKSKIDQYIKTGEIRL